MSQAKSNRVKNAVHLALLCGAATSLGLAQAALGADQSQTTTSNDQSTANIGKIEVTGTKIKRTDVETAQPVTIISAAQIKATGLATIGDILQKLTSSGAALNTLANDGGNFTFTGGGQTNVDLRYLGAQRVLVLVNGKRWVTALDGTVDLNTIPTSVIDHIEVLQDGASAIYGSEAISGVVNIITLQNYNGREANAYLGTYNGDGHWDGKTQNYDFTIGSSSDKSNLTFNVSYMNQGGISSADRRISQEPTFGAGLTRGSSATPQGRFVFNPLSTITGVNPSSTIANPPAASTGLTATQCPDTNMGSGAAPNFQPQCDLTLKAGAAGTKPGDFRHFNGATDRFNFAPFNYVLTPEERIAGFLQGHTDLADNLTFKTDLLYTHRDSTQQAGPEPLFFASTSIAADIPANQPFNPFGVELSTTATTPSATTDPLLLIGRRMIENGPRIYNENEDTFYFNGGLDGFFNAVGGEWDWNAYYAFSKDTELDTNKGHFNLSFLNPALGSPAGCTGTCVPLNLFGGEGSITPAMLGYIGYVTQNEVQTNQRIYAGDITNSDLANLPGGPLGFAGGYQYIENDGFFQPSPVAEEGNDTFNPGRKVLPTSGRIVEKAEYVEFDIPIVSGTPGFKMLDLDAATRRTTTSTYGSNNSSKLALKWQPNDQWLVRGTWAQGYRAPNINELFESQTNLSAVVTDPCSNYTQSGASATVQSRCANGFGGIGPVPASYVQFNGQINTQESGNPALQPETSISRTVGFVYSPDWMPGLNGSADYYRIELNNTIQPYSGQALLNNCYVAGDTSSCARISRGGSGAITGVADFISNAGTILTEGIDGTLNYAFPSTSIGDFKAGINATYVKWYTVTVPSLTGPITTQLAGVERGGTVFPFGIPHHKTQINVDWNSGSWSAEWDIRYISALTEPCGDFANGSPVSFTALGLCSLPTTVTLAASADGLNDSLSKNYIGSVTYHDAQVSYKMDSWDTTFTLGARNLFGRNPPSSTQQQLNSFDPTLYDVPGRFIYGRISVKF